jgi:type I restriction enzyme S subunit
MKHQLELILVGSTFKRINIAEIKALTVLVPPRKEQGDICAFLDTELAVYEATAARTNSEIALLREYRTRLIADVVTGKLDVRSAAAALPGETPIFTTESDTNEDTLDESETSDVEVVA